MSAAVAEVLTEMRRSAGVRQSEVAEHLGVSRPAIAHWEGGRHTPPDGTWAQLERFYRAKLARAHQRYVERQAAQQVVAKAGAAE